MTLLDAYRHGIFPWPTDNGQVFWWSPDPRAVIPLDGLHISRSLRRRLASGVYTWTYDRAFAAVVDGCVTEHPDGTWIIPELIDAYLRLHEVGAAHSVEVWADDELVGGVFGVTVGGLFTGESMFHRRTDASKVALVALVERLRARGFTLLDAQNPTEHLESMGAVAVARDRFLDAVDKAVRRRVSFL